jgi:hypothetical protein
VLIFQCIACFAGVIASPPVVGRVHFQEHWLSERLGIESLQVEQEVDRSVNLDQPMSVFNYVFSSTGDTINVMPTELYYYWHFAYGDRTIHGNIRFTDIDKGVVHFGFFDPIDRAFRGSGSLGAKDGMIINRVGDRVYELNYLGAKKIVHIPSVLRDEDTTQLIEGERLIATVLDESGLGFDLIYFDPESYFYFVLRKDSYETDELLTIIEGMPFEFGVESRFVYYAHPTSGRKVLVGVSGQNIWWNNYFDGPFDQVPPNLSIKDELEAAYPYVSMRGGIDEHGNFVDLEHQRVSISPYQDYKGSASELVSKLSERLDSELDGPRSWLPLVFESKKVYHLKLLSPDPLPGGIGSHELTLSKMWPAGHLVFESRDSSK